MTKDSKLFPNVNRRVSFDCFWRTGCSDSARCNANGSCVAASQAGGATFTKEAITSKTESFPLGILHKGVRFHIANERDALRLLFTMVRDNVCSVEQAMSCMKEMPSVETFELRIVPTAWVRGVKDADTANGPGEWNADFVYGDDPPDGDGWVPLYSKPPHIRPAVEPAAEQPKDYAEVVLRVEIASDTDQKVESFRQQLCDAILAAPAALRADVMVTIHREGQLSVFETNRTPVKATADLPACECLVRNKAPSAYHNIKCPRYVADLL